MSQNLLRKEEQLYKIEALPKLSQKQKPHNYIRYSVQTFLRHKSAVLIWSRLK